MPNGFTRMRFSFAQTCATRFQAASNLARPTRAIIFRVPRIHAAFHRHAVKLSKQIIQIIQIIA